MIQYLFAFLLSSLMMCALVQHYVTIKRHYQIIQVELDTLAELQFATELLRNSIRQAGFTPCSNIEDLETVEPLVAVAARTSQNQDPWLQVNRMQEQFSVVSGINQSYQLITLNTKTWALDRPVLISDCYHAEIQSIAAVSPTAEGQLIVLKNPLHFSYVAPIFIGEWINERYFIRTRADGKRGLFYQRDHTDQLTTAIHNMMIDVSHDGERAWVKIRLLLRNKTTIDINTRVRS